MTATRNHPLSAEADIDGLARQFLHSKYAGTVYVQWPLDRRLVRFLQYCGLARVADDGDLYNIVLDRVMAHISKASGDMSNPPAH
jgi:hypothetical protein